VWILTQFAVDATPYLQCVAVSTTSDATGTYNLYSFSYGTQFPDYGKLGVWPDGYYITFNIFTSTFQGTKACAYDAAAMRAGLTAWPISISPTATRRLSSTIRSPPAETTRTRPSASAGTNSGSATRPSACSSRARTRATAPRAGWARSRWTRPATSPSATRSRA